MDRYTRETVVQVGFYETSICEFFINSDTYGVVGGWAVAVFRCTEANDWSPFTLSGLSVNGQDWDPCSLGIQERVLIETVTGISFSV